MDLSKLNEQERKALQDFSDYYQEGQYEDALNVAKQALKDHPTSKAIWHNQVGALTHSVEGDYVGAYNHYTKALEAGFDKDICDDNMWESAKDLYDSLKTEEGDFNAILIINEDEDEDLSHDAIRANHLVGQYIEQMPDGKFIDEAKQIAQEFKDITNKE